MYYFLIEFSKIAKNVKSPRRFNLQRVARAWHELKKSKIAKNVFNNPETIIVYDIGSSGPVLPTLGPIYWKMAQNVHLRRICRRGGRADISVVDNLGKTWGHLGDILGTYWGHLGDILGTSSDILRTSWGHLGDNLGTTWGQLGDILAKSWGHLGAILRTSWGHLGASGGLPWAFGRLSWASWGLSWAFEVFRNCFCS